jgi:hypothetical protein
MEINKTRIALIGIALTGLLIGGTAALMQRSNPSPATVAAPEASVPGYEGPLYDAQGKLVGYAPQPQPDSRPTSFAGPQQAATAPEAAPARPAPRGTAYSAKKPRSTGKSVAIVAGTAGVGTAIGALAGGGKGAAIGAISGGGAGYVYDRLTRKR